MVALELEVLAKKMDRFGWDRDRGSASHDRIVTDWMDALQDFPLREIQAACKAAVKNNPNKIPNEGHVIGEINKARRAFIERNRKPEPERSTGRLESASIMPTKEAAADILKQAGFRVDPNGRVVSG